MTQNILNAAAPDINATVLASAGTGKTWLLTTRIVRLLLQGAEPASILAITFGNKAASEMQSRVRERIDEMANSCDSDLCALLTMMGIPPSAENQARARALKPQLLQSTSTVRISTFHAFCSQILHDFALEADVPPSFEILQNGIVFEQQAWQQLMRQAQNAPQSELGQALQCLFTATGSLHTCTHLAQEFLQKRGDFWAFSQHARDPADFAYRQLAQKLPLGENPFAGLDKVAQLCQQLVAAFTGVTLGKTIEQLFDKIGIFLLAIKELNHDYSHQNREPCRQCQLLAAAAFLTGGKARAFKPVKATQNQLGAQLDAVLALHGQICDLLLALDGMFRRAMVLELNRAWFIVGHQLTEHYQQLKTAARLLDFVDIEWLCYRLLSQDDNINWVQYKLDARINHLLFDEFQDTNPTQWHLVKPLLEEIAASAERHKSVFLVGDVKQSIYSFRRANPKLQNFASDWLGQYLGAQHFSQNKSRRCAPAVIDVVNQVFSGAHFLHDFAAHQTHRDDLWGKVVCLGMRAPTEETMPEYSASALRDPLTTPPLIKENQELIEEAEGLAAYIGELLQNPPMIDDGKQTRALVAADIFVLFRRRADIGTFANALKKQQLPYQLSGSGDFFNAIEVQDMLALLAFLAAPFDDYQLAVILRAPIFNFSHALIFALAQQQKASHKTWWQALQAWAKTPTPPPEVARAVPLLKRWLAASQLPVHDLLELIYRSGAVLARYRGYNLPENRDQAQANLIAFLHLALEVDAGRYPSIGTFLARARELASAELDSPSVENQHSIQLMTMHKAKGLEAPVVILANSNLTTKVLPTWSAQVRWRAEDAKPADFMLYPTSDKACDLNQELLAFQQDIDATEADNLLYVALTRAKHLLVVSGNLNGKDAPNLNSNYAKIRRALWALQAPADPNQEDDFSQNLHHLSAASAPANHTVPAPATPASEPNRADFYQALFADIGSQPSHNAPPSQQPSHAAYYPNDGYTPHEQEIARLQGIYIHQLLETPARRAQPAAELSQQQIRYCLDCAKRVQSAPDLQFLFNPQARAHSEQPIFYRDAQQNPVMGVMDRVVFVEEVIYIVDYKTRQQIDVQNLAPLAEHYRAQLASYAHGMQQIYPDKTIKYGVLFTAAAQFVALN